MRGQYSVRGLRIDESVVGERGTNNICLAKSIGLLLCISLLRQKRRKNFVFFDLGGGEETCKEINTNFILKQNLQFTFKLLL